MAVNTKQVQRRKLRFESADDVLAEIDRIVAADEQGKLKTIGNWTPGQILGHLSSWIDYGYVGYPLSRPPWFVRMFLQRQLKRMLDGEMPPGVRIPRIAEGTVGTEVLETSEGAERLRRSWDRLKRREPATYDSPAFGSMSHDDRIRLNLRHAELHLSFLNY